MSLTVFEELEQGTPEWLEARRGIVTASVVGKLLTATGKVASNETSRTLTETLVAERVTGRIEYLPPNRDMQRGNLLEPTARKVYADHYTPVTVVGFGRLDLPTFTLGASPDGLTVDAEGDGGIEIKCPRPRTHMGTLRAGKVPAHYMAQIQACMYVFGRDWWNFVSYSPGLPLYVQRVYASLPYQAAIVEACERFHAEAARIEDEYAEAAKQFHPTTYWDPFEDEEEIY